jgi:CRISPR/Cas system CMR-associated protein Cmr3 (group 5 of RAMP superfamily)
MSQREGLTELTDLSGSGDNVLVKAKVTHEQDLDTHCPYQKGLLWDQSMNFGDVRSFVVYDPDLRLDTGKVYILNGKDHYYERQGEVQVLLHEGAYVNELYDTTE